MNAEICLMEEGYKSLDAVCTESLTSLSLTWIPLIDPDSEITELPDSIGVFLSGTRAPTRVMAPQVKTRVPTEFYQSQHRGRHCSDVELRESQDGRRGWKTKSIL